MDEIVRLWPIYEIEREKRRPIIRQQFFVWFVGWGAFEFQKNISIKFS